MKNVTTNPEIKTKYFSGLIIIFICIIFSFMYMKNLHNTEDRIGEIINTSGKQRMLSQRTTLFAQKLYVSSDSSIIFDYENLLEMMYNDHIYIMKNVINQEILDYYSKNPNLNSMILEFIELNHKFIKEPTSYNLDLIFEYQNKLLPYLDNAVLMHEILLENENAEFNNLLTFILIFILIILILEVKFIYLPIVNKISKIAASFKSEKDKFQTILENATDGIHILNDDGDVILCSNSFARRLGYTIEEAYKLNIRDWNATTEILDLNYVKNKMGKKNTYQTIHKRKDGTTFHVQATVKPITLNGQELYYASSRDITELVEEQEKKQEALERALSAEEEALAIQDELYKTHNDLIDLNLNLENRINEANKELNHSLNIIGKHIITSKTDLKGNIVEVSDKFCEISKYSREELLGQNHRIVKHPDMSAKVYEDLWKTIKSGNTWQGRIKNKDKEGNAYWVDSTISPEYDINDNHIGYFSYRIDVTHEVLNTELHNKYTNELEEKVKEQLEEIRKKDLKMLDQAKMVSLSEMMSNIAHQWRQPLNIISISGSGIKYNLEFGGLDKEDMMESVNDIISSCDDLTKTIETFSRFLNKNKTVELNSIEKEILSSKYIIESSLEADLIKLIDEIDYEQTHKCNMIENELSQVIINILNNAQYAINGNKAIEDNKWIKITSNIKENTFTIMIEDNAGGIQEDIKDKIFEPYFTTKFKSQGAGLGLSMSYDIIKDNIKGDIYFKNTENGAKFYLELPIN